MRERLQETLRIHRLSFSSGAGDFFNINLDAFQGEVHGLVMANPQFKNPFYDLFKGNIIPDSGMIYIDNEALEGAAFRRTLNQAVYAVGLKSGLIASLTLAENLFLVERGRPIFLPARRADINEKAENVFLEFGLETIYDPRSYPETLTPAKKHIVELLRAHIQRPRVIYIDNITLIYSREERKLWEQVVRKMADQKQYAILLTLNAATEGVMDLPDRISIIRNGTTVMHLSEKPFRILQPERERIPEGVFRDRKTFGGEPVLKNGVSLELTEKDRQFSVRHLSSEERLRDISFQLYRGETLGIFTPDVFDGEELVHVLRSELCCSGKVFTGEKEICLLNEKFPKLSVGMIPYGKNMLFYNRSLFHNVALRIPARVKRVNPFARKRVVRFLYENVMKAVHGRELLEEYGNLKRLPAGRVTKEQSMRIQTARWLFFQTDILLMTSPENCYDSGNLHKFVQLLEDIHRQGASVIIFSENLEFLQKCSGRLLELRDGKLEGFP